MNLGNFPKADCGRFWILASTHIDQPKSTEKLNKAILLNLRLFWTFNYWTMITGLNNGITLATFLLSGTIPVSKDLLIIRADQSGIRIKFMDVFNILYKNCGS